MAKQFDIIMVWYQNDWGLYGRRNEMLARTLAKHAQIRRVIHLEPPINLDILKRKLKSSLFDDNVEVNLKRIKKSDDEGVWIFTPHVPGGLSDSENRRLILKQIRELIIEHNLENIVLWLYPPHQFCELILDEFGNMAEFIVSDCVDDHRKYAASEVDRKNTQLRYEKMLRASDAVFCVSDDFRRELAQFNSNTHYIPNAILMDSYNKEQHKNSTQSKPHDIRNINNPVIGYVGALSFRIDCELLKNIATVKPDWNIVLIGTSPNPQILQIAQKDNVYLLGPKKYTDISRYITCFDVCIIPHLVDDITSKMNPLKLYEYLKHGKPVVSTGIAGVKEFKDVIEIASDTDEFISGIEHCLRNDSKSKIKKRVNAVKDHNWSNRIEKMLELLLQDEKQAKSNTMRKALAEHTYYHFSRPEIQALVPSSARKILDVGCGVGALGAELKKRQDCKVMGIEYVPEMGNEARRCLDEVLIGDIEVELKTLPSNNFDCIILADVLEHLREPEHVLNGLKKCLNENGRVVVSIPNVRHWSVLKDLLEGRWDYVDAGILDRTHLRFFTKSSLTQMFKRAGFQIEKIQKTIIRGCEVPQVVITALNSAAIDTSSLAEEGEAYQYLIVARPEKVVCDRTGNIKFTSIIILTHNQLKYTKKCIDSIFKHTKEPFELIVVDNGSTDGTVEYLKKAKSLKLKAKNSNFCEGFKIIENKENRGFAMGNNQGMAIAKGDYVLLLNNDIVVTPGWLERMLVKFKEDEKVGIVGPRTNYVDGSQLVPKVTYSNNDMKEMKKFAEKWSCEHAGKRFELDWVIGFCMLIGRDVVEKIGGLDARFGSGNFEDDDYCLRARVAGYKIVVADDVFVHHFGSRTFIGAKIDYRCSIESNWVKFKNKWGISPDRDIKKGYIFQELLAQSFDPRKHYQPLTMDEFFNPTAKPLPISDKRSFNFLMFPDWSDGEDKWSKALLEYIKAFNPKDDVSLILRVEPERGETAEVAQEKLLSLIRCAGYDSENIPDIVIVDQFLADNEKAGLYTATNVFVPAGESEEVRHILEARACGVEVLEEVSAKGMCSVFENKIVEKVKT